MRHVDARASPPQSHERAFPIPHVATVQGNGNEAGCCGARVPGLVQDEGGRLWIYATGMNSKSASLRLRGPARVRHQESTSASDGEQRFELCDVLLGLGATPRHFARGWIIPGFGRYPGLGATRRLARPGAKLPA